MENLKEMRENLMKSKLFASEFYEYCMLFDDLVLARFLGREYLIESCVGLARNTMDSVEDAKIEMQQCSKISREMHPKFYDLGGLSDILHKE